MNVLDSSGWIELFREGPNADFFQPIAQQKTELIVPTIVIYEVYRQALVQYDEAHANAFAGAMVAGQVVDLDANLATSAATLAHEHKLAMADAIILATAQRFDATVWTQDADFESIPGVQYRPKLKP